MQMQRQRLILIAAGAIISLMALVMVKVYIDQQKIDAEKKAKERLAKLQANSTPVLIAKAEIPRGAPIDPANLDVKSIPNEYIEPQAVTQLDRVAGMITLVSLKKGEQITLSKLSYATKTTGGLAAATPVGKRAITISVDNISSLAGMLKPGDYVDILSMIPIPVQTAEGKQAAQLIVVPLFQNVLVLAVGRETAEVTKAVDRYGYEEKKESSPLITLALNPQEANLVAFVQEQSKIRLVLRSPADSKIEPVQPATLDTLLQYIMPPRPAKEEAAPLPSRRKITLKYTEV